MLSAVITMKFQKLSNQHKLVLFYLIHFDKPTLYDIILHGAFFKFQTRLGELELKYGKICQRGSKQITTRFGVKTEVKTYKALDKQKLINVFGSKAAMYAWYSGINRTKINTNKIGVSKRPTMKRESLLS